MTVAISSGNPAAGLGGIALASLLGEDGLLAQPGPLRDSARRIDGGLHHRAKAKRVVQLFMSGAASQCDTFDYKPELIRRNGQAVQSRRQGRAVSVQPRPCHAKPVALAAARPVRQVGQRPVAPHRRAASMTSPSSRRWSSRSNVHGPATFMQNTGFVLPGFPSDGGVDQLWPGEHDREPARVRRHARFARLRSERPRQLELPPSCRPAPRAPRSAPATAIRSSISSPARTSIITPDSERDGLRLLQEMNRRHQEMRPGDSRLEGRIQTYELAARMQLRASGGARHRPEKRAKRSGFTASINRSPRSSAGIA